MTFAGRLGAIAILFCNFCTGRIADANEVPSREPAAITTARELFDLFGIDEEMFRRFVPGEALSDAELEPLAQVLSRLPQIKSLDVQRWTRRDIDFRELAKEPERYQREIFDLKGRVRRVTREIPSSDIQDRFAIESYFRCEILLEDQGGTAVVFSRQVPKKWQLDAAIDEAASANAVFLKVGPMSPSGASEFCFAADRVAWHPETLLGRLGMDYGLFDTVQQMRPITNEDRECFFQLLAAAGRAPARQLISEQVDSSSQLGPLLKSPEDHLGELYTFRGVARRAVKIHVTDPDTVARFGFDHYFELVVFLEIDGIVAGKRVRSHPVVFCVRELPTGTPMGENIAEVVRATGFMFKKWRYTTQESEAKNTEARVFSPLLVGKTAIWEPASTPERSLVGSIVGGVLIAVVAIVSGFVWWLGRRERRLRDAAMNKSRVLPIGQSLENLSLDSGEIGDEGRPVS